MRCAVVFVLAAGGLLALSGCRADQTSSGAAPTVAGSAESTTTPAVTPSATASPTPAVRTRTIRVTRRIPYTTRRVSDSGLRKGSTRVRVAGRAGVKVLTYKVTLTNGAQTARRLIRTVVTRRPVTRVVAVGTHVTHPSRRCDPNYSGACVPIASDVDCVGNGGNGPAYVRGPVYVTGRDIYGLDRDGDGTACD